MNLANKLTWLRLILAPFAYATGLMGERFIFGVVYFIGVFTDTIDGSVARYRKEGSKWGSALDTIADIAFFPSALCSIRFFPELARRDFLLLGAVIILLLVLFICIAIKNTWSLPHLFSTKAATGALNVFVLMTVFVGFNVWLFYLMLASLVLASAQKLAQVVQA